MATWDNLAVVESSEDDDDDAKGNGADTELSWDTLAAKGVTIRQLSVPR